MFKNTQISRSYKDLIFEVLIGLFPLSFIIGNTAINLNIILLIIASLFFYRLNFFNLKFFLVDKFILSFFLLIILTGFYNDFYMYINLNDLSLWKGVFATSLKSFFFLRYLVIYFILRFLLEKNIVNLKIFFFSCSFFSIFVCFDIFYQFRYGIDLFGYENIGRKFSGPFDDELIAGGYIQRFFLFSFFSLILIDSKKFNLISKFVLIIFLLIFNFGIIISGNRMPFLLFLLCILLFSIFQKNIRKHLLLLIVIVLISSLTAYKFNNHINKNFGNFKLQVTQLYKAFVLKNDFKNQVETSERVYDASPHAREFKSFYHTWLMNKYFGGGIKNFRYYCHLRANIDKKAELICNMHPHNYYLEILTETGIVGGILFVTFFFLVIFLIASKTKYNINYFNNNIISPFFILFLVEIFPFKSTGSFFTTGNATYFFLITGLLVGLIRSDNFIDMARKSDKL